jgi:uncharacterized protein (TIGR03083 family)
MPNHLAALRRDGDALLHAAGRNLTATVPSCPGWTTLDLLDHLGRVYRFAARQARSEEPLPPDDTDLAPEVVPAETADALAELLLVLRETDPQAPAWNWDRDAPAVAGYWSRRMALETVVHRWDAENATGTPAPIDPALACDGIDEVLTRFLPRRRGRTKEDIVGTVHLHAVDAPEGAPSEWTVELGPGGATTVRHVHEKADAALRGPAAELLLAVWGRTASVERFGDADPAAAIHAM